VSDLFGKPEPAAPLAEALRPKSIDDVVGQRHLLGPGKPLRLAFQSGKPHSMILWGPPGSGKTTLARLMATTFDAEFIALSAVFSGVKDIREAVQAAQTELECSGRHTILFVDEVHRFNKAQQDAFLPYVERGLITFVGATTENPSFEVNSALLSRASVYVLEPLDADDLGVLLERTGLRTDDEARARLIGFADGDARRLFNAVEILKNSGAETVDGALVERVLAQNLRRFDKGRPDIGVAQVGARVRSRRSAVLDGAHAGRRRRPAVHRAPGNPHGGRGHRARRPARAEHRARRLRDLRAARLAGGRARSGASRALSRRGRQVERRVRGL
jgi:putative ATPase